MESNDEHRGPGIIRAYPYADQPVYAEMPTHAYADVPTYADITNYADEPVYVHETSKHEISKQEFAEQQITRDSTQAAIEPPSEPVEFPESYRIFSTVPKPKRRASAFFWSLVLHGSFIYLLGMGLDLIADPPAEALPHEPFLVLQLTPPTHSPSMTPGAASSAKLLDPVMKHGDRPDSPAAGHAAASPAAETADASADGSEVRPFQLPPPTVPKADYTLVQRDARPQAAPKVSIRVPEAIVWSAQELAAKSPIVPGPELGAKLPDAPLSLDLPKPVAKVTPRRLTPAIAAAPPPPTPVERASTAPVKMNTPEEGNRIPESLSRATAEKSAGHLISVSDIPLPPEALIAIPPVSQIAALRKPDLPAAGPAAVAKEPAGAAKEPAGAAKEMAGSAKDAAGTGRAVTGNPASANVTPPAITSAVGIKDARGANTDDHRVEVPAANPVARNSPPNENGTGAGARAADRNGASDHGAGSDATEPPLGPGVVRINHPPDGKPSSIVLGASSREAYPESAGVLACRIVYTVYVQVGLPKSWILQFCLPDANDGGGTARGTVAALDAPWPFRIIRPPLTGLNGDYTLVHGVVNTSGRFERLALVIPDEIAKNELVPALQQWQFRSASRDGQPTAVEIMLIIPHRQE